MAVNLRSRKTLEAPRAKVLAAHAIHSEAAVKIMEHSGTLAVGALFNHDVFSNDTLEIIRTRRRGDCLLSRLKLCGDLRKVSRNYE
jgi:hypothetical protein